MPDIHFGGEAFPVEIEQDPWESPLSPELASLIGKPLPGTRLYSTEAPEVPFPLDQLGRFRNMLIFLPQIATPKAPLIDELLDEPTVEEGLQVQRSLHEQYENLLSIGFHYVAVITSQAVEEQRTVIRPEPRQMFFGLSDPDLSLAGQLGLPTFTAGGRTMYLPLAIILREHVIEKIVHPINDGEHFARWAFNWARIRRPDLDFLNYNLDRGSFTRKQG